jgi:PAS domain S-box-containing protein
MTLRLDLLATVAHDLRTPLASLQGYLELLLLRQSKLDDVESSNYLHTAVRQCERLNRLVNDLFEWSRLEAGETQPSTEDFVLDELLQDLVQSFADQASQRQTLLRAEPAPAGPMVVRADIALIERALRAVLDNALRHTPAGGSVTIIQGSQAQRAWIEVHDTGSGIAADALANVFSHYERSERVSGPMGDGQGGLGLAIARRIARLHGSELNLLSRPGQGTRVRLDLPLATPGASAAQAMEGAPQVLAAPAPGVADTEVERLRQRLQRSEAERERERATAQAAQRALEERYGLALRGAREGLWEWDLATQAVHLSPRWKSMLGFLDDEVSDDMAGWLARVHADDRAALDAALRAHLAEPQCRFEQTLRLLHKDGSVRHALSRGVAIRGDDGTPYRMVGMDTDVTEVRRVQTVLDAVVDGTSGVFGAHFFTALVQHFARALDVDCAFITECVDRPSTRLRTLAFWSRESGIRDNFEFSLAGTPCDAVVNEAKECFFPCGVGDRFPREQGFEAYLGMPIIASDGRVLGHLAFLSTRPRGEELMVRSVYRIFLARAAAEIERLQALARPQA